MNETTAERVLAGRWAAYAARAAAGDGTDLRVRAVPALSGEAGSHEEAVAPFGAAWPGLAAGRERPWGADPDELAARVLADVRAAEQRRLAEYARDAARGIAATRPAFALGRPHRAAETADLLARRGLTGLFPYGAAELTAVLTSWEERFGTRLVGLDHETLILSVAAPPRTPPEAERVAAEHFAFSCDTVLRDGDAALREYAANQLVAARTWRFWWD
ncbi:DUF4253 domain-containing protein [Streptomyces sp. NPDC020983]|uniref:DUF4253 domain-containing protein n=1 Tax=Streptomyces sp. NPDC020983 TaxID=3365106 RepID=UPI0037BA4DB0